MKLIELFNFRKEDLSAQSNRRAVIALGGGGARGIAHLGAMQLIGESGIQTERIVGVSIGSLVGAMCAVEPDIRRVQAATIEFLHSSIFLENFTSVVGPASKLSAPEQESPSLSWYASMLSRLRKTVANSRRLRRAITGPSLMHDSLLRDAIEHLLPDIDIRETAIPLSIVAADLISGQRMVLESGSLRQAVLASTAIPGFFPPVNWENHLLCDIGVLDSLPTEVARSYASDMVIGVDVGADHTSIPRPGTAMEVMMRMDEIGERILRRTAIEKADVVIRPSVGGRPWFDFSDPERAIGAGRTAAQRDLAAFLATPAA
ncbi:patatin-like phospholipase family protein [Planctomycetes bacterium K23_9]|uniref:NTE family protein RssA n=1 Tax=Stieleria marina TaxID=1930275 RepID=A0A517NZJ7_9BACT|nr:NTE family protein RssA [Planctomycetes bacterium K23_9]